MKTATEVITEVKTNSAPRPELRVVQSIEVGQAVRQGDVYITRIADITNKNEAKSWQLAPGTSKGSRHIVEQRESVRVYAYSGSDVTTGPQIGAKTCFCVTHPEHADIKLPAGNSFL